MLDVIDLIILAEKYLLSVYILLMCSVSLRLIIHVNWECIIIMLIENVVSLQLCYLQKLIWLQFLLKK